MKQTLLDFSLGLSKKQKIVAAEKQENETEVVSVEDDRREADDISIWRFRVGSTSLKKLKLGGWPGVVWLFGPPASFHANMHTLSMFP